MDLDFAESALLPLLTKDDVDSDEENDEDDEEENEDASKSIISLLVRVEGSFSLYWCRLFSCGVLH